MAAPDGVSDARLLTMRIVIGALAAGVFTFAGVAVFMRAQGAMPPDPAAQLISFVALGFGVLMLLVRTAVVPVLTAGLRKKLSAAKEVSTDQLLAVYQTRMIVGAALLEGPAFFFLVAYLIEGQSWTLAGGVSFGVLLAVLGFPTRDRVEEWLITQREALTQERLGL